jgi:hypothetical protein
MSTHLDPVLPSWLTLALAVALLAASLFGTLTLIQKQVSRRWTITLSSLRLSICLVFVLILFRPIISLSISDRQLPDLVVLVDTSSSMSQAGGHGTRLEEVTGVLRRGDLAAALTDRYHVHWFAFDGSARSLDEADVATLKPSGSSAHFGEGIEAACSHVRAIGKHPVRLLLVSDGNDRGQLDPVETARRFGIAVDVLSPSVPKGATPTVTIAEVQSARRVLLGSDTIFRVALDGRQPASKDRPLVVHVTEDGKNILDHPIVLKAGHVEETLQLSYRPASVGVKQYGFHLTAGAEPSAKPYPLAVQVVDGKYEVLILEDRWRWEYKYLHRLFEDDPSFRFSALLNRGGGAHMQFASPDRRVNLIGFPQSKADLEGFDTFVLGDVDPGKWPRGLATDLARLVADEGRSLVVIAGPDLANLLEIPELHAILPIELTPDSGKPIDGPIAVRLRTDSGTSPFFFQLRGDNRELTPFDQIYPVLRKRPGATVLVEAVNERNAYGNRIVLAEHTVGRGRVLFVGTDTLWKWHTLAPNSDGPTPYSIFWQQAFRAMTPARSNAAGVNLWLTAKRSRAEVGRPIVLQAEVQSSRAMPTVQVQGFMTSPDNTQLPLVFAVNPTNPRLFRAEFIAGKPGVQRVSASVMAEGKVIAETTTAIQTEESRSDTGIDLPNRARIAQDSGGKVIDLAQPATWPMPAVELPRVECLRTFDLWSNFTLMILLCGLLGADWFIRLFKGLASG